LCATACNAISLVRASYRNSVRLSIRPSQFGTDSSPGKIDLKCVGLWFLVTKFCVAK